MKFRSPSSIRRAVGAMGRAARQAWEERHKAADSAAFDAAMAGDFDGPIGDAVLAWKQALAAEPQKIATRVASQKALDAIIPACPALIGGSADLTGSNNTRAGGQDIYSRDNPAGSYVHYGVREHGMAAAMNGIALHGGAILWRHLPCLHRLLPPVDPAVGADEAARRLCDDA